MQWQSIPVTGWRHKRLKQLTGYHARGGIVVEINSSKMIAELGLWLGNLQRANVEADDEWVIFGIL